MAHPHMDRTKLMLYIVVGVLIAGFVGFIVL